MFSKLRGATNGGGVVVFMDTVSMGWLSGCEPASKSKFMVETMAELSRPLRLCAVDAVAHAECR